MAVHQQPTIEPAPLPAAVPATLARAYAAGWLALAVSAVSCAVIPGARWLVHAAVGLPLRASLHRAPTPTLTGCVSLLGANARATCWPLLPAALRTGRSPWLGRIVDAAVAFSLAVNLLPVGAALGLYRLRLLLYLPQLPLELYALTSGAGCWWLASCRRVSRTQLAVIACSMLAALAGAAVLETWAVPHR